MSDHAFVRPGQVAPHRQRHGAPHARQPGRAGPRVRPAGDRRPGRAGEGRRRRTVSHPGPLHHRAHVPAGCPLPAVAARADRAGQLLSGALGAWAQENLAALVTAEPEMPEGVHGRTAQIWQPLLAIADQVSSDDWPERARAACEELAMRGGVSDDMQMDAMDELAAMFSTAAEDDGEDLD